MLRTRLITLVGAALACALLAFAGVASAQEAPSDDAYGGQAAQEQSAVSAGGPGGGGGGGVAGSEDRSGNGTGGGSGSEPVAVDNSGSGDSLPFTGFQLGMALALGVALAGTGLVLRRTARAQS